ncbi:MAG: PAS domain-containing protein, partial [Verrucomicrobiales bacterium]|nr:PAS domain-containing protein [Verrucomicrobiales bacterium]
MHYAMEAAQDGIWDWDIVTGEVYYSPRWARLLGYEPEEVPQRVEFFFQVLHPDDIAVVKQRVEDHLAGRTEVKQDEVRLRMKSGEYRWFYDRGKVVVRDEAGTPLRMVGTITDITARKVVESALRVSDAALKAISQGVLIT